MTKAVSKVLGESVEEPVLEDVDEFEPAEVPMDFGGAVEDYWHYCRTEACRKRTVTTLTRMNTEAGVVEVIVHDRTISCPSAAHES